MTRSFLALVPWVCALGSITALVFINISGSTSNNVVDRFYFSEITGHYRWTMYALCSKSDGSEYSCSVPRPAYPYSPLDNFGTTGVPQDFISKRNTYYYLSRTAYGFFIVALLFSVLTAAQMLFTHCSSGSRGSLPSTTSSFLAFITATIASTLNTAAHVKGVQVYNAAGIHATLGRDMFVCMWVSVGLLLIAFITLGVMARVEHDRRTRRTGVVYSV